MRDDIGSATTSHGSTMYVRRDEGGMKMHVLVVYGSKRGGTAGLAEMIGEALVADGLTVDVRPARQAGSPTGYDGVIVAGTLYAFRWHRDRGGSSAAMLGAPQTSGVAGRQWAVGRNRSGRRAAARSAGGQAHGEDWGRGPGHLRRSSRARCQGFPGKRNGQEMSGDWRDPEQVRGSPRSCARSLGVSVA